MPNPFEDEMSALIKSLATHKRVVKYDLDEETTQWAKKQVTIIEARLELLRGRDE